MIIKPDKDVLKLWSKLYVPDKDLFFISKEYLNYGLDFTDVLVMPREEFYKHNTYNQLKYVNSYEYWNVEDPQHVIVAGKEWIETIPEKVQELIFSMQVRYGRGLVVPVEFIENIEMVPSIYIQNGNMIIQRLMWERLEDSFKEKLLQKIVHEWWDNGECFEPPKSLPQFLKPHANKFSHHQGANCLAAVLYAVAEGKPDWFIYEWIHQETFIEKLKQFGYEEYIGGDIQPSDLVIWKDKNGIIQHAAYHIDGHLYFNKQGQTMFNPWKIISEEQLFQEWDHLAPVKYRQNQLN